MSISTPFPLLRSDHKILGSEYCSGYSDVFGKWNTGFYCPQSESKTAVSCCGTPTYKYCCTVRDPNENQIQVALAPYFIRTPVIIGMLSGFFLVLFLIILTSCYFCSCCFFYKKRRAHLPGGLYRLPLASSSTTSALMNTYSTSSNFSNATTLPTTPLDVEWNQFQQNTNCPNTTTHRTSLQTNYLSNRQSSINNAIIQTNNSINGYLHGDLLQQYISAHTLQNQSQHGSNYRHSTLPRYFHHHQTQNQNLSPRPPSSSSLSGYTLTPPRLSNPTPTSVTCSDNSSSSTNHTETRGRDHPTSYIGYTISTESRPYLISTNFNSRLPETERPRSVINLRNNVAYITSTLPLTNSFTTGRRTVHFRDSDLFIPNGPPTANHNRTPIPPNLIPPTQLNLDGISEQPQLLSCPIGNKSSSSLSTSSSIEPQVLPIESMNVTSPNSTSSGRNLPSWICGGEVDMALKVTSTSSSKPSFPNIGGGGSSSSSSTLAGLTGGATGDETTGRSLSLDTHLFPESMTGSSTTAFGMGPDNSNTQNILPNVGVPFDKKEFSILTLTSVIPTTQLQSPSSPPPRPTQPHHHPKPEGHSEEPHYKVLSSPLPSSIPPSPISISNSPLRVNGHPHRKNTTINQLSKITHIPIETHRIVL